MPCKFFIILSHPIAGSLHSGNMSAGAESSGGFCAKLLAKFDTALDGFIPREDTLSRFAFLGCSFCLLFCPSFRLYCHFRFRVVCRRLLLAFLVVALAGTVAQITVLSLKAADARSQPTVTSTSVINNFQKFVCFSCFFMFFVSVVACFDWFAVRCTCGSVCS